MNEVRYCQRRDGHGRLVCRRDDGTVTLVSGQAVMCEGCVSRFTDQLRGIGDNFALLPAYLEPGAVERNPDAKTPKSPDAAAPVRLDVVDLLDSRRRAKWLATVKTDERRGVAGVLVDLTYRVADGRPVKLPWNVATTAQLVGFLTRHAAWIADQEWAPDAFREVSLLHRRVSDAVGNYLRPAVGVCHLETELPDGKIGVCGGRLRFNQYGSVRCGSCAARWDPTQIRMLGMAIAEQQGAG